MIYYVSYKHGWKNGIDGWGESYSYQPIYSQFLNANTKKEIKAAILFKFPDAKEIKVEKCGQ